MVFIEFFFILMFYSCNFEACLKTLFLSQGCYQEYLLYLTQGRDEVCVHPPSPDPIYGITCMLLLVFIEFCFHLFFWNAEASRVYCSSCLWIFNWLRWTFAAGWALDWETTLPYAIASVLKDESLCKSNSHRKELQWERGNDVPKWWICLFP